MKDIDNKIGLRIQKLREVQRWSREKLAEEADLSPGFLSDIETGKKGFSAKTLSKLCAALSVNPNFLLFGISDKREDINYTLSRMDDAKVNLSLDVLKAIAAHNPFIE